MSSFRLFSNFMVISGGVLFGNVVTIKYINYNLNKFVEHYKYQLSVEDLKQKFGDLAVKTSTDFKVLKNASK